MQVVARTGEPTRCVKCVRLSPWSRVGGVKVPNSRVQGALPDVVAPRGAVPGIDGFGNSVDHRHHRERKFQPHSLGCDVMGTGRRGGKRAVTRSGYVVG